MRPGVALALLVVTVGCGASNEVTIYPMDCRIPVENDVCNGDATILPRQVFAVFPEKQVVVLQVRSFVGDIETLAKCSVRNVQNWECKEPNRNVYYKMIDGEFRRIRADGTTDGTFYVSQYRWWLKHIRGGP